MTIQDINKLVASLSKIIEDNEKIALSVLSIQLSKAASQYPDDYTIGMMNDVIGKMSGSKLFITRSELKELYSKLYSRNTKFSELFKEEIKYTDPNSGPKYFDKRNEQEISAVAKITEDVDPFLLGELSQSFGTDLNTFDSKIENDAKKVCVDFLGTDVEIAGTQVVNAVGNISHYILCRANFETPKGKTSIFVPVEIVNKLATIPTVFIGNNGIEALTNTNVGKYIVANAGMKLSIGQDMISTMLRCAKLDTDIDILLANRNAAKAMQEAAKVKEAFEQEASEMEVKQDEEMQSFEKVLNSKAGLANFHFGEQVVQLGKNIVLNKLANCGYSKTHQIKVYDSNDKAITFAVSLKDSNTAFKVPIKVVNGKVIEPMAIIANGSIEAFSKDGIKTLLDQGKTDLKAASVASPLYDIKASDLVDIVRQAMDEENYAKAEDALNILAQGDDDKAYKAAFAAYTEGLNGNKAIPTKCSRVIKSANSQYELCGHLNLPLHKVCQNKYGECLPVYRKGMQESYDGASFMHSKILIGN